MGEKGGEDWNDWVFSVSASPCFRGQHVSAFAAPIAKLKALPATRIDTSGDPSGGRRRIWRPGNVVDSYLQILSPKSMDSV